MTKLKVKEKSVKLKNIDPDQFIKFMIKYQKTPIKIKKKKQIKKEKIKEKKKSTSKISEGVKKERKFSFKIDLKFKLFRKK